MARRIEIDEDRRPMLDDARIDDFAQIVIERDKVDHGRTKRAVMLRRAHEYLAALSVQRVCDKPLRETQKMAALGMFALLVNNQDDGELLAHLIAPPGSGKTKTAVVLADMADGPVLFLAHSRERGAGAVKAFRQHELTRKKKRSVGLCFGEVDESDRDIVITHFENLDKFPGDQWEKLRLITVDEADINGLSPRRLSFLREMSQRYKIPVIGMSATDEQSSGRRLREGYPHSILDLPMPVSLPALQELGLLPSDLSFEDLILKPELKVDTNILQCTGEIPNDRINEFIRSSQWNAQILNHYMKNHCRNDGRCEPAVVVYRDNFLVKDFIEQASALGIRAQALTGETEDPSAVVQSLTDGEIDVVVGSRMLGRGVDMPATVVYNSTLSYSPQIFWQADGRGMHLQLEGVKTSPPVHIYALLPSRILGSAGHSLAKEEWPLCHGAYFDGSFFDGNEDYPTERVFRLGTFPIRSVEDVETILAEYRQRPKGFIGRPTIVSQLLARLRTPDLSSIHRGMRYMRWIQRATNNKILAVAQCLKADDVETQSRLVDVENLQEEIVEEKLMGELTLAEERKLLAEYLSLKSNEDATLKRRGRSAALKLYFYHLNVIKTLAKDIADTPSQEDDLLQVGRIKFFEMLNHYTPEWRTRLVNYVLGGIFRAMVKEKQIHHHPVVENKVHLHEAHARIEEMRRREYAATGQVPSLSEIPQILGISWNITRAVQLLFGSTWEEILPPYAGIHADRFELFGDVERALDGEKLKAEICAALPVLSPLNRDTLEKYYGIGDKNPMEIEEIAKIEGITASAVYSRIQAALRNEQFRRRLRKFMFLEPEEKTPPYQHEPDIAIKKKRRQRSLEQGEIATLRRGDTKSKN